MKTGAVASVTAPVYFDFVRVVPFPYAVSAQNQLRSAGTTDNFSGTTCNPSKA
jgi:hypothetical protein